MDENHDEPIVLTQKVIDDFVDKLLKNSEIRRHTCFKCCKEYLTSYGYHTMECYECFLKRFTKKSNRRFL